jgi:hypothetical protein
VDGALDATPFEVAAAGVLSFEALRIKRIIEYACEKKYSRCFFFV